MKQQMRAELLKLRTVRTPWVAVVLSIVVPVLVTIAVITTAGEQGNDPLSTETFTQLIAAPASIVTTVALLLGALSFSGEFRHQTVTTTFLANPRRKTVLAAKLAGTAAVSVGLAVLSVAVTAAVAVPWLHSEGVATTVDAETVRVAAGLVGSMALYAMIGVAVGAVIRNQTAAIATVLVWIMTVEGALSDLFGSSAVTDWLPKAVGNTMVHPDPTASVALAASALLVYVVLLGAMAIRFVQGRDVS